MAGVTINGFVTLSIDELKTLIEEDLKSVFGTSIDLDPQSNFGQLVGVMADRFADLWALGAAIDTNFNPDSAVGNALDNLAALTGTVRNSATPSTATLILVGNIGTVIPAGSTASVDSTGTRFETDGPVTLAVPALDRMPLTSVLAGTVVSNITINSGLFLALTTGTTAADATGPDSEDAEIVDGTVTWRFLGEADAYATAAATCSVDGPKVGGSGTITVIETPVSGWLKVNNWLDADTGSDLETDATLRMRRETELRGQGKASVESIRAALLEVPDVTAATVFENVEDFTNGDGMPPHSIECLVQGGDDQDIFDAIFDEVAAGIATTGNVDGTVVDSQGISHEIWLSRPTEIPIYIDVTVSADQNLWPADGDEQLEDLIVAWGDAQKAGKDVVASAIEAQGFLLEGALDVIALIKTSASPTVRTTIAINTREIATYDTSRINVTVNFVTP